MEFTFTNSTAFQKLFVTLFLNFQTSTKANSRCVVKTSRSPIVWHVLQKQKYFNVLIVVVGQTFIIHSLQLIWKQNSYKQCTTLYWLKFWIFKKPQNHQRCRARAEKFHWISKKNFFEWDSRLIWKKVEIREKTRV